MSGLAEAFPGFGPGYPLRAVPRDLDQYYIVNIDNPVVNTGWFGTANGGTAAAGPAITLSNALGEWPRNAFYSVAGVASGTFGGTFVANWLDQFGSPITETVVVQSATPGTGVYGTAIVFKFLSGTFTSQGSSGGSAGTASIGYGTASNGSAQSNWFGLWTKIGGTSDLVTIRWDNNGTTTSLNKGTALGTLVDATRFAFQGTSGVAVTDTYMVIVYPTWDNASKAKLNATSFGGAQV